MIIVSMQYMRNYAIIDNNENNSNIKNNDNNNNDNDK